LATKDLNTEDTESTEENAGNERISFFFSVGSVFSVFKAFSCCSSISFETCAVRVAGGQKQLLKRAPFSGKVRLSGAMLRAEPFFGKPIDFEWRHFGQAGPLALAPRSPTLALRNPALASRKSACVISENEGLDGPSSRSDPFCRFRRD
jgi:hypothetical protein